jgi:hypothetical protein
MPLLIKKIFIVIFFFTLLLSFPLKTKAGGGLVYLDARALVDSWNEPSSNRFYVVHAYLAPSINCQNVPVTFKFENPKEGDYIGVASDQQPFIIAGPSTRFINGRAVYDCSTYAKVSSQDRSIRAVYLEVAMEDGSTYTSSKIMLDFETNSPLDNASDSITTPWDNVTPDNYQVGVNSQEYIDCPKRAVELNWNGVQGVNTYTVYSRIAGSDNFESLATVSSNSSRVILDSCQGYYVYVKGCVESNRCTDSGQLYIDVVNPQGLGGFGGAADKISNFFSNLFSVIKGFFNK